MSDSAAQRPVIVYGDMVADLFHWGHMEFLRQANDLGDVLLVGIHDDATSESYKRRPIMSMAERVQMVEACRYVDKVLPNAPLHVTDEWLDVHHIDLVVHGDNVPRSTLSEWYEAPIRRGMFTTIPSTPNISTTELLRRVDHRPSEGS